MYYELVYSDELYHHGVKGQKWGVRKERESLGRKYRRFASKKVNQYYDKKETQLKERRRRASNEVNNSIIPSKRYNNWIAKKNKERYDKEAKQLKSDREWRLDKINNSRSSAKDGMKSIGKDVGNFIKTHKKQIAMAGVAVGTVAAVGIGIMVVKKMGVKTSAKTINSAMSNISKIPLKVSPTSKVLHNSAKNTTVDALGINSQKIATINIQKGKSVLRKVSVANYGSKEARDIRTAKHLMETTDQFATSSYEKQLRAAAKAKRAAAYTNYTRNANSFGGVYNPRLTTKSGNRVRRITSSVLKRYR